MKKVKVGVIGVGEVAQLVHLPLLESMPERYEIEALCDISPGLLSQMGEQYRVNRLYGNVEEMLVGAELDAVFVLNNMEFHADSAIAALHRNVHAFVEKPMCIAESEARAMIAARDASQAQVMVGYMRRFAPAYLQALEEVKTLGSINYARIRGIIGPNRYFTSQTTIKTYRFDDLPPEAAQARREKHERLMREALGEEATADHFAEYGLLLGLNSHDISVMRELLGMPKAVTAAASWLGGRFKSAILEFDGYHAMFETGIDDQGLFDAHIEIYGDRKSLLVQYDTPYLRQLPTTLRIRETHGDGFKETVVRPSYKDAYAYELEYFHRVVTEGLSPKTTPEDYLEDLAVFRMIMNAIRKTEPTGHE